MDDVRRKHQNQEKGDEMMGVRRERDGGLTIAGIDFLFLLEGRGRPLEIRGKGGEKDELIQPSFDDLKEAERWGAIKRP